MTNYPKIKCLLIMGVNDLNGPILEMNNEHVPQSIMLAQPESEYQLPEWDARLTAMLVFSCFSPF